MRVLRFLLDVALWAPLLGLGSPAFAGSKEFQAGHLFVASSAKQKVLEFDLAGTKRNEYAVAGAPQGLAFGPDGRLYVTLLNAGIVAIDASGAAQTFVHPYRTDDLLFVAGGLLLASRFDEHRVVCVDPYNGLALVKTFGAADGDLWGPTGLRISPWGRLFVGAAITDRLTIYDMLDNDRGTLATGGLSGPMGLVFLRDGHLFATDDQGAIRMYNGQLAYQGSLAHADLGAPRGLVFAPDGDVYVAAGGSSRIVRFSAFHDGGASGTSFGDPELVEPRGIAVAPYRFKARFSGWIHPWFGPADPITETVEVAVLPNSLRAIVRLDNAKPSLFLALFTGASALVFDGLEEDTRGGKGLAFQGSQVPIGTLGHPLGSLHLDMKVKGSGSGGVRVKSLGGTLHLEGPAALISGKLKSISALNS